MVVHGHVQEGRIVLDEAAQLPEGVKVRVEVLPAQVDDSQPQQASTLFDRMQDYVGSVEGLPEDTALNHDHYLYGQPKKQ